MLCCVVAGLFIARFIVNWPRVAKYLGFEVTDGNIYGWEEYCELDEFAD
ncbi:MAG: hypothetical protein LBN00_01525 [Oscillospiraceae bacterium]|jgi:hypothetical protein|nr:hypothetical protein [Oscillospiraceae bacterium]